MLTKFKQSELAKSLEMSNASITMAVKRGLLDLGEDNTIDISELKNKVWLSKMVSHGKTFDINRIYDKKINKEPKQKQIPKQKSIATVINKTKEITIDENIVDDTNEYYDDVESEKENRKNNESEQENKKKTRDLFGKDLYEEKLKLEIKKLENADKLDTLKIAKIEGDVLPIDAISTVFLWATTNMIKTYEQDLDNITNIYIKILGGEQKHFIEIKRQLMKRLSATGEELKKSLMDGIENIITEYSEVRGRGERR